jgi:predicted unusual protein kinase regulating ubiquinone biosynthesis (AarF/ABC1/UbiB family)
VIRTLLVFLRLAPLVASFVRDHRRWLVGGRGVPRTTAFHEHRAARLVATVAALGPAFVKLAQVLGARADLIPEPYLAALGTLHDQVPAVPAAEVRRVLEAEYGQPPETLFEAFEWAPLAAASLGQVHRARYGGEEIVVKVLRPGVEHVVARDLAAAARLLDVAERRWATPVVARHLRGVRNVVEEFARRVGEEMDFRHEAENAQAMRANFVGRAGVAVPRVVPPLVRQRALVLEFMPGTRIDRLQGSVAAGLVRPDELVRRVIELYMRMMLVDGFFHADPHPGNLLVQDDGTIVVLDFGMVVRVAKPLRRELARTAFAGIRRDPDKLVDGFYALGVLEPGADRAVARELVEALLEIAHTADTTSTDRMQLVVDRVMHTLYGFPVTLPSDLVYFARTAALIEGLGTRYDARFNAVTFAAPVALRLHREILSSLREPGEGALDVAGVDWATVLGRAAGEAVRVVARAGRELASVFGQVALALGLGAVGESPAGGVGATLVTHGAANGSTTDDGVASERTAPLPASASAAAPVVGALGAATAG